MYMDCEHKDNEKPIKICIDKQEGRQSKEQLFFFFFPALGIRIIFMIYAYIIFMIHVLHV